MGRVVTNKIKLVVVNLPEYALGQFDKAIAFHEKRTPFKFDIVFEQRKIQPTIQKMYGIPGSKMRYSASPLEEGTFYFYEMDEVYQDGYVTAYTFPDGQVTLPVNKRFIEIDWLWKTIAHEMVHVYEKRLLRKGIVVPDEMDNTWVNGVLVPYYKNDDPEAPDGNFAVMFKKLSLFWDRICDDVTVTITRINDDGYQTIGELTTEGFSAKTIELSWKNNKPNVSCIPKGTYNVRWTFSPRFMKYTYEIQGVPKRSGIRIHSANYARQLNGCIALGNKFSDIDRDGRLDVANSRATIKAFETLLNKQDFQLVVK
jgi:hypothetical protein